MAVWGSGPEDVFVAGDGGAVMHYDGTAWMKINSITTSTIRGLSGNPRHMVAVGYDGAVVHLRRNLGWPCRATETQCGDGVDDDCDDLVDAQDPDCGGAQLLREVHGGAPDYIELENNTAGSVSLAGLELAFRLSCDASVKRHTFGAEAMLGPGQVYRVVDDADDIGERERYQGGNICDNPSGGGWVALCAGPCDLDDCTNLLDYFEKAGASSPTGAPACAAFTGGPLDVSSLPASGSTTQSPTRTARSGGGATGLQADWSLAPATRE